MADLVATEYDDPQHFDASYDGNCPVDTPLSGGWPAVVGCRWSDAAFYRYTDAARSAAWGGATIHTVAWSNASMAYTDITGSLTVSADAYVTVGTYVHKIGSTTGETDGYVASHPDGTVSGTCVNRLARSNSADPYVLLLCQDATSLTINSGDSGAPVYRKYSTYVDWVGILWGDDSSYTYHSPAWAVRTDLPNFSY
ncbi:MAG TPA: hypothetical protein VF432_01165 [Thermoanaerobaculia bacterium]